MIFVYGRVMGQVPLASWPMIIEGARAKAGDFLLIADGYQPTFARLFDGVHTYNNARRCKASHPRSSAPGLHGITRRQSISRVSIGGSVV